MGLWRKGDLPRSVAAYLEALRLDEESVGALSGLGVAYAQMGQVALAKACFENALRVRPNDEGILANLRLLMNQDRERSNPLR